MKRIVSVILAIALIGAFMLFALGSTESKTDNQGSGSADNQNVGAVDEEENDSNLGDYLVEIKSCRLAEDYSGKDVVIVKYKFTNNDDKPTAFYLAFQDTVYQDGVGLNESYVLDESADYNADNQTKEIKKGKSIEVEVAYELNDTTTDIEVEVSELISFNDSVVTKTFKIAE